MKLTKNFWLNEFNCNDGTPVYDWLVPNVIELAKNLQVIRDEIQAPLYINSSFRTLGHNTNVGGSKKSQHLQAKAADLISPELTPNKLSNLIESLMEGGWIKDGGLGRYNTFTHYDIRDYSARWDNR